MTIGFSDTVPWWAVIAAFLVVSGVSVWIYSKHSLSRPWSIVLPGMRIAAIAVLALMLKQPRLIQTETEEEKGRVAIVVDNSGSMSISDDYSLAQQIELASRLRLFDPRLRCGAFKREASYLQDVGRNVQRIRRRLQSVQQSVRRKNSSAVDRGISEIIDYLSLSRKALDEMPDRGRSCPQAFEYLQIEAKLPTSTPTKDSRARGLAYKRWDGVNGAVVEDLFKSPNFAKGPSDTRLIPNFDAPRNTGEQTGTTLTGYLHPPVSGNFVFQLASDDQGVLYLSTDTSPKNKQEICRAPSWTDYRRFDVFAEQTSKPIRLQAHKLYYVEAVMKEGSGLDHITVGWTRPDGRVETPIPGDYLTPFGVDTADYFGPDFERLHPEVIDRCIAFSKQFAQLEMELTTLFEKRLDGLNDGMVKALSAKLNVLEATADSLRQNMLSLQESADIRLAYADVRPINSALVRLRKMSRADLCREVLTGQAYGLIDALAERADPKLFVLGNEARHITPTELPVLRNRLGKTDLASNVRDVFKYFENQFLAGVIVLSDGNDNGGKDLRDIRKIARNHDVPLVCLGVGSTLPPRDVAIEGVVAPENSFRNDEVTVTTALKRDGYTGETIELAILSEGMTLCKTRIAPGLESRVSVDMTFVETRSGPLEYTVQAQNFPTEQVNHNNRRTFKVNILKDPIRVFVLDAFPRWESRYLTMMLERDKRFRVKTVYCGMDVADSPTPLDLDDSLLSYDVFVLGDVDPKRFTGDQFDTVRSFLSERQGTLLFLSGRHHMPQSYLDSPLSDLIPLDRLQSATTQINAKRPVRPAMSVESSFDSMVRITGTPEISRKLWSDLPTLDWVAPGVISERTADELVTVESTEVPLLIRHTMGDGTVIYVGSDSFWRWRDRAQWRYYHRFWGQLLLWAAFDRTGSSNPYVKIMTDRPEYRPNEAIDVSVRILLPGGMPLNQARPTLEVYDQTTERARKIVQLQYVDKSDGKYVAVLKGLPFGKYRASTHVPALEGKDEGAEVEFEVRNLPSTEYTHLTLNRSALETLGTHYLPLESADQVPDLIPEFSIPRTFRREWGLWNTFPALALLALLLGLEWYLRKRQRLS